MSETIGRILAIAIRDGKRGPMRELPEVEAITDGGLRGDNRTTVKRGITLLSQEQWQAALLALEQPDALSLPWHSRRANLLLSGGPLSSLIGRTIEIGRVVVEVKNVTWPCERMDEIRAGLQAALETDQRCGVHGRIALGGVIHVGDEVRVAGVTAPVAGD